MKSGIKYFILVILFICIFPFKGYASADMTKMVSHHEEIICADKNTYSDSDKLTITHIPISLLQHVAVENNHFYVSKFRISYHLSADYNYQKKLQNYIFSSTPITPVDIYLHPPGYYIYGLENIRI